MFAHTKGSLDTVFSDNAAPKTLFWPKKFLFETPFSLRKREQNVTNQKYFVIFYVLFKFTKRKWCLKKKRFKQKR